MPADAVRLPLAVRTLLRPYRCGEDPVLQAALRAVDAAPLQSGSLLVTVNAPQRQALVDVLSRVDPRRYSRQPTLARAHALTLVRLGQ